jgi:branched-chain amino acid transport system substrate-binding protein
MFKQYSFMLIVIISASFFDGNASASIAGMSIGEQSATDNKVMRLYHDADWSNHVESAESIWRGVELALSEVNHTVQGYRIEWIKKNHRGNVVRSLRNNSDFLKDDKALAIISGIHSPPLIKNRSFINENKILTLVPWAAGGPITRYPSTNNWVFRLSVDDTRAGGVLVNYALKFKTCKQPHLLLENSPWGDSNLKNMAVALKKSNIPIPNVTRFSWNVKSFTASAMLLDIVDKGADCILFVSNAPEGIQFAEAMTRLNPSKRLPIISHWGITAGDFHERIDAAKRKEIDLSFIQSCFSFNQMPLSTKGLSVLNKAKKLFPNAIKSAKDIHSPVGFIHGYDLTKLLLAAMGSVTLGDDVKENKALVRSALEAINKPIEGLVKTYSKPFSVYSKTNIDAHEALGENDYCMAFYNEDNSIILHKESI